MNYTLKNENIESYNESESYTFPKYTSQLINWANQNAQGTRPILKDTLMHLKKLRIKSMLRYRICETQFLSSTAIW